MVPQNEPAADSLTISAPPPTVFGPRTLTEAHAASLLARWIDREWADRSIFFSVTSEQGAQLVGRNQFAGDWSGIAIPYCWPGSAAVREYRLRRDHPDRVMRAGGIIKQSAKYVGPPDRPPMLYVAPGADPALLEDSTMPIIFTEGEFKGAALTRLSWHGLGDSATRPRFLPVAVSGVWGWRGKIGTITDEDGTRVPVKGPITDFERIVWEGRNVIIAYDSDVNDNSDVAAARSALASELRDRGAKVGCLDWLEAGEKVGVDDLIARDGPEKVLKRLARIAYRGDGKKKAKTGDGAPSGAASWYAGLIRIGKHFAGNLNNVLVALRSAPELLGLFAYDEFYGDTCSLRRTPWGTGPGRLTDQDAGELAAWLQRAGINVQTRTAYEGVEIVARDRAFHPVRAYLDSLTWDKTPRLDCWLSRYVGAADTQYTRTVSANWMISAVARVYKPGSKVDSCLILEGPQGAGKSTALKILGQPWFTDEIADLGSKDAAMQARGVWIIELSELDSISRADASAIKSFMSRSTDRFRPPYGHKLVEHPRQCVFAGSVNDNEYLRDETGARRFWPVNCGGLFELEALRRDRDQLWAEARDRFQSGAKWWLQEAEAISNAEDEQADRYEGDPWEDVMRRWLEAPTPRTDEHGAPVAPLGSTSMKTTVPDILLHCIGKAPNWWSQADRRRVGRALKRLGWVRRRETLKADRSYYWEPNWPDTDVRAVDSEALSKYEKNKP